ncbi:F-box/kelch-repeat protein At3g06240-like [Solanum pennellii]|uniref:F-box/kelch-repeat protein At3g06240-like n=1 Tax=Solanum pennellii TaxID=28526 RepID=A0ABM1GMD0_SOLPN|nr:F-box/kelch-repeat protein At3g06240-like [Solanum pennellii]
MDDCVVHFPEDIQKDILLRCPVKSLLRFKCVSKSWCALIKNPKFVQQHLKNSSPPQLLAYTVGTSDDAGQGPRSITLISEENPQTFKGMTHLIGSVDGLFLMYRTIDTMISCALWNPATREVRSLQIPLPAPIIFDAPMLGFGLDPVTNDYKIVYSHCGYWRKYTASVYSCSRGSWRIFEPKEPLPFYTDVKHSFGTAYLNGSYYWLLRGGDHRNYTILSFEFGSEMFEEIEGPDRNIVYTFALGLMLIDDSIAMLKYNTCSMLAYDIWALIQPGVWNKIVTFELFTPIKTCYDNSLITVVKDSQLVSYNVRTNSMRYLGFQHSGLSKYAIFGGCGVSYYKESLVTFKQQEHEDLDH